MIIEDMSCQRSYSRSIWGKNDIPVDDTMERVRIFTQARDWAEEIVLSEMIYK